MSITNRLSLFFLVALSVVLIGFSAALYGLARWHLNLQLDRHLDSAMQGLVGAIEIHPEDVEWEPLERKMTVGDNADLTQIRWTLHDEHGQLIDCSANLTNELSGDLALAGGAWRTLVRVVNAGHFAAEIPQQLPPPTLPKTILELPSDRTAIRKSLLLTVALSETPIRTMLSNLALAMTIVSAGIWLAAGIWGRWLCRRALLPVTDMADKARLLTQTPESPALLDIPPNADELTELGHAFNQLIVTLRDSIERQQRFAGDASHQLRTPLAAMLAAVDVTARYERSPEEYQRVLAVVQRRGRDLQQIIEILLSLAREHSRADTIAREPLELNAWCRERIELWQGHTRLADIQLQPWAAAVWVRSQGALLGQVFDNLLDNACKYSEVGTPIQVATRIWNDRAEIEVSDSGHGIPAADMAHIFEPFFRSANARCSGEPGIGLGLTVAQRLATVFAGRLEVNSVEGAGTSFRLLLPLAVESNSVLPQVTDTAVT